MKLTEIMESDPDYERIMAHFTKWKPAGLTIEEYVNVFESFISGWQLARTLDEDSRQWRMDILS